MNNNGFFVITRLHRDDLEAAGFNTSNVTDEQMEEIAARMSNAYLDDLFWVSLKIIAEDMGVAKLEETKV